MKSLKDSAKKAIKKTNKISKCRLNILGCSYRDASKVRQLRFRAVLIETGIEDSFDYWRTFRDTWRYETTPNRIPYVIVHHAIKLLEYDPQLPDTYYQMMQSLQMQPAGSPQAWDRFK